MRRPQPPRSARRFVVGGLVGVLSALSGCSSAAEPDDATAVRPSIVVSHAILGAVTSEIVGDAADVVVLIPNGVDPHVYEPSAKDIELLNDADLVVVNGLGLEARLEDTLEKVRAKRIPIFEATDHMGDSIAEEQKSTGDDDGGDHESGSAGHESELVHRHSDEDPHFWTDPRRMSDVVEELGEAITDLGVDIGDRALMFSERLLSFDQDMLALVEELPVGKRVLVTGHESLGYFAERYGFEIIGTILPGLTSGSEVSAGNLADVKQAVEQSGVDVVFTEIGTPSASARVLSEELGVEVVEISTHLIPDSSAELMSAGDSYVTFIESLVETIVSALSK